MTRKMRETLRFPELHISRNVRHLISRRRVSHVVRLAPRDEDFDRLPERVHGRFIVAGAAARFGSRCDSGTKHFDEIRLRQQPMKRLDDRVGALALRAGKSAHQKNDSNAVRIRARRQPSVDFSGREMSGVHSLAAQQPNEQLGRKIIGW